MSARRGLGRAGFGVAAFFCMLPPFAVGGGLALAPAQAVIGILTTPVRFSRQGLLGFLCVAAPFVLLALWAAASLSWSPLPRPEQAGKILGAIVLGLVFVAAVAAGSARDRALIRASALGGCIVLAAMLAVDGAFDLWINRLAQPEAGTGVLERNPGKGTSVLVVLLFGLIGALAGGERWEQAAWKLLALATFWLALQFNMATNWVAFALGAIAFALTYLAPRLFPLVIASGVSVWMLAAPWVALWKPWAPLAESLPDSWRMRLEIWDYAAAQIAARPLTGYGLDATRVVEAQRQVGDIVFTAIPLHPHSLSMHVWYETGLVGASLFAAGIFAVGAAISRTLGAQPAAAAGAAAALTAVAAIWNVSYGAWQEWWIAAAFAAAACAAAARRSEA